MFLCSYLLGVEKHLSDSNTYKKVKFKDNELVKLMEESNRISKKLLSKKCIFTEECKYFLYSFKKSTSLGKHFSSLKYTKDYMIC